MKMIEPRAELLVEKNPYKKIERAGRICYKSEDRITEDSAQKFARGLIKSQHTAMVEHQVFTFELSYRSQEPWRNGDAVMFLPDYINLLKAASNYLHTSIVNTGVYDRVLVTGSVRALNECELTGPLLEAIQKLYPDLVYRESLQHIGNVCATIVDIDELPNVTPEEYVIHKHLTFLLLTDRGVSHELVRHRPCSFAQESTRYVNYMQGLSIALPTGFAEKSPDVQAEYEAAFMDAERHYCNLLQMGEKPQQGRAVLPTGLKTELVMTTNLEEWRHFFNLRYFGTTGAPHPDMKVLASLMLQAARTDAKFDEWAKSTWAELRK